MWASNIVRREEQVQKVPSDISPAYAATVTINPSTAYRLLRDYGLKRGDVVIQNAANSMVGIAVIQMAREMGITTINVIRSDRYCLLPTFIRV